MNRKLQTLLVLALAALLAGCAPAQPAGITVTDAWARKSTAADQAGVAYLTIHNGGSAADRLVAVTTSAAGTVELNETTMTDGMMGMAPVDAIEVPAGGQVELKPGGYHLMLIDLTQDLKAGDKLDLTLTLEQAGTITVTAEVRDE